MGFKLPKGCREYFSGIVDKSDEKKLSTWFDAYYLCLMVGFAQAKVDKDIKLESEDFNDDFPLDYQESKEYIIGSLIASEVKLRNIDITNSEELEGHIKLLVGTKTKTNLTDDGEDLMNQYAAYGYQYMREKMTDMPPIRLEEFYEEYFEKFRDETFFES